MRCTPRLMAHLIFPDMMPTVSMDVRAGDCTADPPKVYFLEGNLHMRRNKSLFIKSRGNQRAAVKMRTSNTTTNRKLHLPPLCRRGQTSSQLCRK